jgi:translocator assembly and maintenance protein 41
MHTEKGKMSTATDEGQLASQTALSKIIDVFPQENLTFAFGYGSGVFTQSLLDEKHEGMLDMILVVDDAYEFHNKNIERNPHHYAPWLRYSGPRMANRMQRNFMLQDAYALFHVVDDPIPMKYGVVHQDDIIRDLTLWESLYLAGR